MSKILYFVNDRSDLNIRYRSNLIELVSSLGFSVESFGFFESKVNFILTFVRILLRPSITIVSSNLRSNLISLLLICAPGMIILNGMGRYRSNKLLRFFLLISFLLNFRKFFVIQNYADYRFFSRYLRIISTKLFWIPGSGGTFRTVGTENVQIVQRPQKLSLVSKDVKDGMKAFGINSIVVVGCSWNPRLENLIPGSIFAGFVPQSDILSFGKYFLQPYGYGEGFPHTLADALVSDMDIYLTRQSFISFGLYKLKVNVERRNGEWMHITSTEQLRSAISCQIVSQSYLSALSAVQSFDYE